MRRRDGRERCPTGSSRRRFRSRPLDRARSSTTADLVLTAEAAHRQFILDDHPGGVPQGASRSASSPAAARRDDPRRLDRGRCSRDVGQPPRRRRPRPRHRRPLPPRARGRRRRARAASTSCCGSSCPCSDRSTVDRQEGPAHGRPDHHHVLLDPRGRLLRRHRGGSDRHGRRRADDAGADLPGRRRRRRRSSPRTSPRPRSTRPAARSCTRREGSPNLHLAKWLIVGSVPMALLGPTWSPWLTDARTSSTTCSRCASASRCCSPPRRTPCASTSTCAGCAAAAPDADPNPPIRPIPTLLVGALGGLLVGITSVGSGSVIMIALLMLYPGLSAVRLVGTDLVQAVPAGAGGRDLQHRPARARLGRS